MNIFTSKLKEITIAVLPIMVIVLILNLTVAPLKPELIYRFVIGTAFVILGLTLFLVGVELGIMPFGNMAGKTITRKNKLWLVIAGGLVLGFFISVAEPGLLVFADQVQKATSGQIASISLLIIISVGLAILIAIGFIRIVYNLSIKKFLFIAYLIILIIALFASSEFLAIAFDASGATTGELAVPFILALSIGVSSLKKDSLSSEESSFGLVALASVGAILAVLVVSLTQNTRLIDNGLDVVESTGVFAPFVHMFPDVLTEGLIAMSPIIVIFIVMQLFFMKLDKKRFIKLLKGFLYTVIGLVIFLLGVNAGFMEVGMNIGQILANNDYKAYILIVGFALGFFTVMAEPAVYVLTHQIEDITSGYIKRKAVLFSLAVGVGIALLLSVTRIINPEIQLWYFLLPGYIIAFILSVFTPNMFVGIAFDGGGVATGPITATFILAFIQGAANAYEGASVVANGFGMIALVALFPIISLQILGIIFKIRTKKVGINNG